MDVKEEWRAIFTCGLCESVCNDYVGHECLEDYNDVHIDENYYFYPLLDDKETIVQSVMLKNGTVGIIHTKICVEENGGGSHRNINNNEIENPDACSLICPFKCDRETSENASSDFIYEISKSMELLAPTVSDIIDSTWDLSIKFWKGPEDLIF